MATYMVAAFGGAAPLLDAAIRQKFPAAFQIETGKWVLNSTLQTSKDVSDSIGLTTDTPGAPMFMTGIVVAVKGYYGRGPTTLWEWLSANYS